MNLYCGNNRLDPRVLDGSLIIPDPHRGKHLCFKKGIGKGLSLPMDPSYGNGYEAINNEKVWCGVGPIPNASYSRTGSIAQCFQKGVGVGKKLRYERDHNNDDVDEREPLIRGREPGLVLLWLIGIFIGLFIIVWTSYGFKESLKAATLGPLLLVYEDEGSVH